MSANTKAGRKMTDGRKMVQNGGKVDQIGGDGVKMDTMWSKMG